MPITSALCAILAALLLGAMSPGPSFVLVARTAIAASRRDGLAAAAGMGAGGMLFSLCALMGLYTLLASVHWLDALLRWAGGAYLLWLAWRIWRGAAAPLAVPGGEAAGGSAPWHAFRGALGTQLSNPKTALVYGSIFAALLPADAPRWVLGVLPPLVFLVEAGWYALVALCFSAGRPRALYLRAKASIDRAAAFAIGALGLRLILGRTA